MANEQFKIYLLSNDKDSITLLKYYVNNLQRIINNGFPKPAFKKYDKKELKKI
jgi:hypothetical protein